MRLFRTNVVKKIVATVTKSATSTGARNLFATVPTAVREAKKNSTSAQKQQQSAQRTFNVTTGQPRRLFSAPVETKQESLKRSISGVRVAFRTPITQLAEKDQPHIQRVVDAITHVIKKLQKQGKPIEVLSHAVLTRQSQKENLQQKTPKQFRIERLYGVRAAEVFAEIITSASLSLSGAIERGYGKAIRDISKRLTPGERVLLNEKFPARIFQGYGRSVVVMHNGLPEFGGPLITTLYKQDPDTDYVYIKHPSEKIDPDLSKNFPGILVIEFNDAEMESAFTEIFEKIIAAKQEIVNKQQAETTVAGLVPPDEAYTYRQR